MAEPGRRAVPAYAYEICMHVYGFVCEHVCFVHMFIHIYVCTYVLYAMAKGTRITGMYASNAETNKNHQVTDVSHLCASINVTALCDEVIPTFVR